MSNKFATLAIIISALTACSQADTSPETSVFQSAGSSKPSAQCLNVSDASPVLVPGGEAVIGSVDFYPDEGPVRTTQQPDFLMDATEVTNAKYQKFVSETGYITVAERKPDPALHPDIPKAALVPGSAVFLGAEQGGAGWSFVPGADWQHPEGPDSNLEGRMSEPVVHIAYEDALAYAKWAGGDLPTAEQWEYAARGGLDQQTYAWGQQHPDSLDPKRANTWQGVFPVINSAEDGFAGIAPVGCYPENGYGLYDMTGNTWEWVREPDDGDNIGTIKGGSYLCADNYCQRYRPAARHDQELDFSTNHISFRVVYPVE